MEWIGINPHEKEQPPFKTEIIITDGTFVYVSKLICIATYEKGQLTYEFSGTHGNCSFATHWMPLPKPPTK